MEYTKKHLRNDHAAWGLRQGQCVIWSKQVSSCSGYLAHKIWPAARLALPPLSLPARVWNLLGVGYWTHASRIPKQQKGMRHFVGFCVRYGV